MPTILDRIMETKLREVAAAKTSVSENDLAKRIATLPPTRNFRHAIHRAGWIMVIAEVKKASPSAGIIRSDFDPVAIARTYEAHGAAAISVLTDTEYFQGSLGYLSAVRSAI